MSEAFARENLVVGFADLTRFLAEASSHDDLEVAAALQLHYERMDRIVSGHGGRLIKLIGDAVLFCFPGGSEEAAVACAREMAAAAETGIARELGSGAMRMGVGLSCGQVVAGQFGCEGRKAFDVIGDAVNVAALACHGEGVKISEALGAALGDRVAVEPLEPIRRAGREIPVYRVLG